MGSVNPRDWKDEQKSDEFAIKASQLLAEYVKRIESTRHSANRIVDKIYSAKSVEERSLLKERFANMSREFDRASIVYKKLAQQCSQWLSHGKISQPHLRMEMEVRLADLESMMSITSSFFYETPTP